MVTLNVLDAAPPEAIILPASSQNIHSDKSSTETRKQVGCLLIHGFTGSPKSMEGVANFLVTKDINVSLPLLPGHGTKAEDLFECGWHDWAREVDAAYTNLTHECDEVFVCGLSMGGTLALHLAAQRPVSGVVALAAPIIFPRWQQIAVRYLKYVVKYRHKKDGEDVCETAARASLDSYRKYPYCAVEELFRLTNQVRHELSRISVPVLSIHSRQDHTIDFSNAEMILQGVSSSDRQKVTLRQSYHIITVDCEKNVVHDAIWEFMVSHSRLLSLSTT